MLFISIQSVSDQVAGRPEGKALGGGFLRPGGGVLGGPGGPGRGDRGFGVGGSVGPVWRKAADSDANGQITAAEPPPEKPIESKAALFEDADDSNRSSTTRTGIIAAFLCTQYIVVRRAWFVY